MTVWAHCKRQVAFFFLSDLISAHRRTPTIEYSASALNLLKSLYEQSEGYTLVKTFESKAHDVPCGFPLIQSKNQVIIGIGLDLSHTSIYHLSILLTRCQKMCSLSTKMSYDGKHPLVRVSQKCNFFLDPGFKLTDLASAPLPNTNQMRKKWIFIRQKYLGGMGAQLVNVNRKSPKKFLVTPYPCQ